MRVCGRCCFDRRSSHDISVWLVSDETSGSISGGNQKRIEEASEQQQHEPCMHLVGDISPDELEETLSRFRSSHTHAEIAIYDPEQISFPNSESDWTQ